MSFPVVELIAQALMARIERVTIANGFNQNVSQVIRPVRLGGYSPGNLMAVVIQDDPTRDAEYCQLDEVIAWRQPFGVVLFVAPSEKDTTPFEQAVNVFRSDVEKAICTDPTGDPEWWHFSETGQQLAAKAHLLEPKSISSPNGAIDGLVVGLEVLYLTPTGDPYTVASY